MKKLFYNILLFIITIQYGYSFHIAPTFFEQRIDGNGGYQEYTMYNNSNKIQRFKVSVLPGTGKYQGDQDKWVEFNPKIMTIKPQSSAKLRVLIKAPIGTKEGEYSSFLNFKSIPLPELIKEEAGKVGVVTRMGLNVNIEIVGYVGDMPANLEILNLKIEDDSKEGSIITFDVKNNTKTRGVWFNVDVIKNKDDYKSLERGRVAAGKTDKIKINLKDIKKSEIQGIRLKESATYKKITQVKI